MKKIFALFVLSFALVLASCGRRGEVSIVYTNDVHSYITKDLSYGNVAALKQDLAAQGKNVALVDAGDFIQGTIYGAMDQGANVVKFMNAVGYDLAVFGNHEFDYGMERALDVIKEAAFPLVACNFVHAKDNKPVVAPYKILRLGKSRVAFVGIMTPETYSKTSPKHFMDKDGKTFLYKILGCDAAEDLYESVQKAVDQAARKADYVVALGHLGVDASSIPWRSEDVIARTHGIDAFIDGHSHTVMEQKFVKNDKGQDVLLTQTGCYFGAIGLVELNGDQKTSRLIKEYKPSDAQVDSLVNDWMAQVDKHMGTKIATCDFPLCANSPVGKHERLVRKQESNLGDFVSDAFYWHFNFVEGLDCDLAFENGGGLRSDIPAGDVTYSFLTHLNLARAMSASEKTAASCTRPACVIKSTRRFLPPSRQTAKNCGLEIPAPIAFLTFKFTTKKAPPTFRWTLKSATPWPDLALPCARWATALPCSRASRP